MNEYFVEYIYHIIGGLLVVLQCLLSVCIATLTLSEKCSVVNMHIILNISRLHVENYMFIHSIQIQLFK